MLIGVVDGQYLAYFYIKIPVFFLPVKCFWMFDEYSYTLQKLIQLNETLGD